MVTIPGVNPIFMWIGFILLILIFLFLDLGVFNKKSHSLTIKQALLWTLAWFIVAMLFNVFVYFEFGKDMALQFVTGYLIEKSLSVDNLFVILVIFTSFKVLPRYQHKVLFWGIVGALILRGIMIILGVALVSQFHWIFYIFGVFLIYAGIKMFYKDDNEFDPHNTFIVRTLKKFVPISRETDTSKFFIKKPGQKTEITILFVALLVIEFTDIIFAFDSLPAIFAISTDPFIIFTSNVFAILGLRSLYFVIAKAHDSFEYLNYGLGTILGFIGVKMLTADFIHISVEVSLLVVVTVLAISIISSILHKNNQKKII